MIVKGAQEIDKANGDAGREADRTGQSDIKDGVLVAVADPCAQDFSSRGETDGGALVEHSVHVAHQTLGLRARARGPRDRLLGLRTDRGVVALYKGLSGDKVQPRRVERLRLQLGDLLDLKHVRRHKALAGADRIRPAEKSVGTLESDAQALDSGGVRDAKRGLRYDRGDVDEIAAPRAEDAEQCGLARTLLDYDHSERTLLAHDLAGLRDPHGRLEADETAGESVRRDRPTLDEQYIVADDLDRGRGVGERRRIDQGDLKASSGL